MMMVKCIFGPFQATLVGTRWRTEDRWLQRLLEVTTKDPPAQPGDPELWIAEQVCAELDGRILEATGVAGHVPTEPGAVY